MPRSERAKQFAPFDALKGLHRALRLKEFEHERIEKGNLSDEKIGKISEVLNNLKFKDKVKVVYFEDGHYFSESGQVKIDYAEQKIEINHKGINFLNIMDISLLK